VANALVHELTDGKDGGMSQLDELFLRRVGADVYLPEWRRMAAEQFEQIRRDDGPGGDRPAVSRVG
jgi:hypothetical protein